MDIIKRKRKKEKKDKKASSPVCIRANLCFHVAVFHTEKP